MTLNRKAALFAFGFTTLAAGTLNRMPLQPESKVWVNGGSTVRDYKCTAGVIDATVLAPTSETASLPIAKLINSAEIVIPIAQLDCRNGTMNEHMRKALKTKEFPRITFTMDNYKENTGELLMSGSLTIGGVTRPVQLLGAVTDAAGVVRATGKADIKMSEWSIKPPSLMMGTMKVNDKVTINYDVVLKR